MKTGDRIRALLLTWNDREQAERCLDRLLASDGVTIDALVVDNGSAGDDAARLRDRLGPDRVLALPENRGYAGGMNAGLEFWLEEGSADPILIVTPDAAVTPVALRLMLDELARTPDAGVVGPVMYYTRGQRPIVGAGGGVEPRRARAGLLPGLREPVPYDVDYVDGCCMLVRPEAVAEGARFDPAYFIYFEEMDFCGQVRAAGRRVRVVPGAEVDHPKHIGRQPPYYFYYMARNRYRFWKKNYGVRFPRVLAHLAAENARAWASVARSMLHPARRAESKDRLRDARLHGRGVVQGTRDYLRGRTGKMPDDRM